MICEISEALKRLAAEYEYATTQEERDRLRREIAWVSYSQEADRAKSRRNSRQGAFDAAMLSLDAHMETFDDPSKIATFSDGGRGAESVCDADESVPTTEAQDCGSALAKVARRLLGGKSQRLIQVFDLLVATRESCDGGKPDGEDVSPKEAVIRGLMRRNRMSRKVAQTVFLREMKKLEKIFLANKNRGLVDIRDADSEA